MKKIIIFLILFMLVGCKNTSINKDDFYEEINDTHNKEELKENLTDLDYKQYKVDELGEVPIMMYHGVHNKNSSDTNYIGGNVDRDGYQRTSEAFRNDLDFYYSNGYRMVRLTDYVDGNIEVELGKSPIILTFDDGLSNNIKVTGIDEEGNLIIDPNCAVGILESFKEKYPDYNVTATFFLNAGLFNQKEYNEEILNWLIDRGYDIGNHTANHVDFTKITSLKSEEEVGKMYSILDDIIPGKYVNIIALPFGSPYSLNHSNMDSIFNSNYKNKNYITKSALRVGWKAEESPYHIDFNPKFLKRIRAYDNNGADFDIEMNFKLLETSRYISDGDVNTIVTIQNKSSIVNDVYNKNLIFY